MVFRTGLIISVVAIVLMISSAVLAFSADDSREKADIRKVIETQAAAWNRGDVDGYMAGYENSPETTFVSGDNVTRGWQTVLERYKKGYSSREKMGTLTFSDLDIEIVSANVALVDGRWNLARASDNPHGRFTLVFRKSKAGWRIVHDHTTSLT